jgi:hypothetical protein
MENFMKNIENVMGNLKEFILVHKDNPFLWIGLFAIGFFAFKVVQYSLEKEK